MEFNSLDAQCEASMPASEQKAGCSCPTATTMAASGGTLERRALKRLLDDIDEGRVDTVVVYKSTGSAGRSPSCWRPSPC